MNDPLNVVTRLLILAGLGVGLSCTTHSELRESTKARSLQEPVKEEQQAKKSQSQKPGINVLITGRITNELVDFGGCPKIYAANIRNKNGTKSHNSKTFMIQDEAVSQILGRSVGITADKDSLNGFQVLTDKNGFYSVCDKVDGDLREVSYELVGFSYLKGRCAPDEFFTMFIPIRTVRNIKLTSNNSLPTIHFSYLQIKDDKLFEHTDVATVTQPSKTSPGFVKMGASEEFKEYIQHFKNAKCP